MEKRSVNTEFFARSMFRNSLSICAAIFLGFDLLLCVFIVIEGWFLHRYLSVQGLIGLVILVPVLFSVWGHGALTHELIHTLIQSGEIREVEKGSTLDKTLGALKRMVAGGVLAALAGVFLSLIALGDVLFRR